MNLILFLILNCSEPNKINLTNEPWNDFDEKILARCKQVCYTDSRYKNTPCLKYIIKHPERHYSCVCGTKE